MWKLRIENGFMYSGWLFYSLQTTTLLAIYLHNNIIVMWYHNVGNLRGFVYITV